MEILKIFATFGLNDALSAPLAKMTSQLQNSGSEVKGLSNEFISMSKKMLPIAETTNLLTNAFNLSAGIVDKLQVSVAKTSTILNSAKASTESFSNKILQLAGSTDEVIVNLGTKLVNSITSSIPVTKVLGDVMSTVDKTIKFVKTGFSDMGSIVDTTKTILNKFGIDLTKVDIIQKGLALTQGAGIDVVKRLVDAFSSAGTTSASMVAVVKNIGASVLDLVKTNIPVDEIASSVTSFISEIMKGSSTIGNTLKSVLTTVAGSTSDFIGNVMQAVSSIDIGGVLKSIGSSDIFETGKQLLTSLAGGISSVADLPGKVLETVFGKLSSAIKGPKEFVGKVVEGVTSVINALPTKIGGAISTVASFAGKSLNTVFGKLSSVVKAPKEFFTKVIEGISSVVKTFPAKISGVVSSIVTSPKEFLGKAVTGVSEIIKSPQEFLKAPFKGIKNIFMPDTNAGVMSTVATGIDEGSQNLVSTTDTALANTGITTEIGTKRMSAQSNDKDSQNVTVNIANLNLPSVENVASFIDELRSLKISLGV